MNLVNISSRVRLNLMLVSLLLLLSNLLTTLPLAQAATPGSVVAWGDNASGQSDVPTGLNNVIAISAGTLYSLALKSDGSVVAWGDNQLGQTNVPVGLNNVIAISAESAHSLALKSDGTVVAWGYNAYGQTDVPLGLNSVTAISAGGRHSLALKSGGSIVAWGDNSFGQINVPTGLNNVTAISAGLLYSLALTSDGTVVAWGDNSFGQINVPAGLTNVIAISAGFYHSLALKSDGSVVAWGANFYGQTNLPAGLSNVTAISAGGFHNLALKRDGTVSAWGSSDAGEINTPPTGLSSVTAIAAGGIHNLALYTPDTTAPSTSATTNPTSPDGNNGWFKSNVTVNLSATDNSGGSGVKSITYSATGAHSIPLTTVSGPSSSFTLTTDGTTFISYFATDNNGNVETAHTLTIKLDKTKPTILFSGNAGIYTIDQSINITCQASDATSGLDPAKTTCPGVSNLAAYTYPLVSTTLNAIATDKAGNVTTASTSFTVQVTFDSLCTLSANFSTDPAVDQGLCDKLVAAKAAAAKGDTKTKNNILNAYRQQVTAQTGKALTKQQATILTSLSKSL